MIGTEFELLAAVLTQARIPLLVLGDPGIGKTTILRSVARRLSMDATVLNCSTLEPTDLAGFPYRVGRTVEMALLREFADLCTGQPTVEGIEDRVRHLLVLDELNAAPPSVHAALLSLLYERTVGGRPIGDWVAIVATANPPESGVAGFEIPPPMMNRLCVLSFEPSVDGLSRSWFPSDGASLSATLPVLPAGWRAAQIAAARARVLRVLQRHPSLLSGFAERDEAGRFASPRSWDQAAIADAAATAAGLTTPLAFKVVAGLIGTGAARVVREDVVTSKLPDPERVISGEEAVPDTLLSGDLFVLALELVAAFEQDQTAERFTQVADLLAGIAQLGPRDAAATAMRRLLGSRRSGWPLPPSIVEFEELAAAMARGAA